ncbi:hypothetical protein PIB30_059026 [Stylosanthes scabra]|uniref:Uncharacterized protein n=1 Tax=Stylosanthes scabra TaxID=79078 RepID=A0ABU6SKY5_9FABA|nr:hypothetical protein [Stylosanthes scabra]
MVLTKVDVNEGKTGDAMKGAFAVDSAVDNVGEKAAQNEADEELTVGVIRGVYRKIRELLENMDGATRKQVEALRSDIAKLNGKLDCHNRILQILWGEYAEGRKARKGNAGCSKPTGRRWRPKAPDMVFDLTKLQVDEIMKKLCGDDKAAQKGAWICRRSATSLMWIVGTPKRHHAAGRGMHL